MARCGKKRDVKHLPASPQPPHSAPNKEMASCAKFLEENASFRLGSEWFLQIAPSYVPRLIGWLLKKHASASPEAIQALAHDAFSVLSERGRFGGFMWCWDGYPEEENSTPEPVPYAGEQHADNSA
jgi:hypothetical protein